MDRRERFPKNWLDETIRNESVPVTFGLPKRVRSRLVASIPGELLSRWKRAERGGEKREIPCTPSSSNHDFTIHSPRSRSVALTLTVNATQWSRVEEATGRTSGGRYRNGNYRVLYVRVSRAAWQPRITRARACTPSPSPSSSSSIRPCECIRVYILCK